MQQPEFVPADFDVPARLETDGFRLSMLSVDDVEADYEAVMESRAQLHARFGGPWPRDGFTLAENRADLQRHQHEFLNREAFAYTVVDPGERRALGCVYVNPSKTAGADAEVTLWARSSELANGLDKALFSAVRGWMDSRWPFSVVAYPGREPTDS